MQVYHVQDETDEWEVHKQLKLEYMQARRRLQGVGGDGQGPPREVEAHQEAICESCWQRASGRRTREEAAVLLASRGRGQRQRTEPGHLLDERGSSKALQDRLRVAEQPLLSQRQRLHPVSVVQVPQVHLGQR